MAGQDRNNTIKIGVAVVALIAAIALPLWYFSGSKGAGTTPPAPTNPPPTAEEEAELRQRPVDPNAIEAGA